MNKADLILINSIANRAVNLAAEYGIEYDKFTAVMDIEFAHLDCPLYLQRLLDADDGNFGHDVFGIRKHMNRETKKMEDCFLPRFAVTVSPEKREYAREIGLCQS